MQKYSIILFGRFKNQILYLLVPQDIQTVTDASKSNMQQIYANCVFFWLVYFVYFVLST